jgi:menaquinol-cytochrome c reductase iron-sulfur subunit
VQEQQPVSDCGRETAQAQPDIEGRRGFLVAAIYALLSLIAGSFGITSAAYLLRGTKSKQGGAWADAGDIAGLQTGVPHKVTFDRTRIDGWRITSQKDSAWIIRDAGGSLTAFSPLCTHLGCAYQWQMKAGPYQHGVFVCPCHGSTFSQTGEVITGPANRPLDRVQVKREGARIWLGTVAQPKNVNI